MITRNEAPCWHARCDKCGEGDNTEWGGSFHYESEAELIEALSDMDWIVFRHEDGSVCGTYCASCWDEMTAPQQEGASAC